MAPAPSTRLMLRGFLATTASASAVTTMAATREMTVSTIE